MILLYMAIAVYGGFVLPGSSRRNQPGWWRCCCRACPASLLSDKIAGIGLAGLTQFIAVAATAAVTLLITRPSGLPPSALMIMPLRVALVNVPAWQLALAVVSCSAGSTACSTLAPACMRTRCCTPAPGSGCAKPGWPAVAQLEGRSGMRSGYSKSGRRRRPARRCRCGSGWRRCACSGACTRRADGPRHSAHAVLVSLVFGPAAQGRWTLPAAAWQSQPAIRLSGVADATKGPVSADAGPGPEADGAASERGAGPRPPAPGKGRPS